VLETNRLRLRRFTYEDLDETAAMLGDPETMHYYPAPKSRAESLEWIEWNLRLYAERGFGLWVLELKESGEFAGDCGLVPQDIDGGEEIEIGYHVVRRLWRRGLAGEAAAACRDYARDRLGLDRVVSIIDPENVPSQGVARSIGMELEREIVRRGRRQLLFALEFADARGR
jgi:RimJ/RimL family protein N-acetyltransferase